MNLDFGGKQVVVCGSTQGIGRAIAIMFSEYGATVTLIARNEQKLQETLKLLQANASHSYIHADFSKPQELRSKLQAYTNSHSVDILINNTGGPPPGPAHAAEIEDFEQAFTQHLICHHILTQSFIPQMREKKFGRIINIISTSVKQPIDGLGVSNTIRGAVANWAKTLAGELGKFGITVNNVLPGFTDTQRLQAIIDNRSKKTGKTRNQVIEEMQKSTPVPRFASPSEIAAAVVFLASTSASYINGINLPVDGGRTLSL